jgi:uncharacterized protein (DUF697 family)
MARKAKLGPLSLLALLREVRTGAGDPRPLAVAGARELVPVLARALREGGDPSAVVEGRIEGAAALVWIGPPDEAALREAGRAEIPVVAVSDEDELPYVLATDVVHVQPGHGFPLDEIAEALARRLGEHGTSLAARLPVLRPAVCEHLIASMAKRNGLIGAAVFIPGADMPMLTLNQVRLVLRLALAHGERVDSRRLPELLGVVGAAFGLRAAARELLETVGRGRWAIRGAVAYGGTKAVGEAALRHFDTRSVRSGS